jgi:hypothetical protein
MWLNMNEELAYNNVLVCINKALIMYVGRYLDKEEYKWFNRITSVNITYLVAEGLTP